MQKIPTGIVGLDYLTRGGLPRSRITLVDGTAGSGKTVLALQFLLNGAVQFGEPGIFVALEENSRRIIENTASFEWNLRGIAPEHLALLDAQPEFGTVTTGDFDLNGLLSAIDAHVATIGARRIVIDGIDAILALLEQPQAVRRELYRLQNHLQERDLTTVITAKSKRALDGGLLMDLQEWLQFMVDCSVTLEHSLVDGISHRNIRIAKYRGTAFEENATPFVIDPGGISVAAALSPDSPQYDIAACRVSTGIKRLDTMLDGGYIRGTCTLLTGLPGTAKTTLAGAFAEAACRREEPTLFVSFDSRPAEVVRNLRSVGIELDGFMRSGHLLMESRRATDGSAEINLMNIRQLAQKHGAKNLIVDPLSALAKSGNSAAAHGVVERMVDWAKGNGMTIVVTSLLDHTHPLNEGTPLQISTIADTWIHLGYVEHAGERNRSLSVIKSRGTGHSNQVRELQLSADGVTLADVYTAQGEVMMGTLRWAKEREEQLAATAARVERERRHLRLKAEIAEMEARVTLAKQELDLRRGELDRLNQEDDLVREERAKAGTELQLRRGADE